MISPGVIFICLKFCFFGLVRGLKGKKIAQNEKQQLHVSRAISPGAFFNFFEIFNFWAASEIKRQKIA